MMGERNEATGIMHTEAEEGDDSQDVSSVLVALGILCD
jgi:hypothetical protein